MKIYIIGSPGSGKTTLAKVLSKRYDIKHYELDCIVYDDNNNHRKRTKEEIEKLFFTILKNKSFIIEDVGRNKFKKGRDICDKIYYIKLNKARIYKQMISRWFKQRLGKEKYNYPPTIHQFFETIKDVKNYSKIEKTRLSELNKYKDKMTFLNKKELNNLLKE